MEGDELRLISDLKRKEHTLHRKIEFSYAFIEVRLKVVSYGPVL